MRVLFCGDVVGRSGRQSIKTHLPGLRRDLALDFVIANGENAAGGFGITASLCDELFAAGVDVVSGGNHSWDQREVIGYIDSQPRLLRPANYPSATPGRGSGVFEAPRGRKVMVLNVMGRLFMDPLDDPFACVERELAKQRLGATVDAIVLDFHGEATSEKMAMGHVADGRVSLVVGTHTHVPTADAMILPGGHPHPCAHRGRHDPARRHRLHQRRGHVRRLRFGDRHGQGGPDRPLHPQAADRTAVGRPRRGNPLRGLRGNRRQERPGADHRAGPHRRPPGPHPAKEDSVFGR
jgi:metallophosphoesterase (TIGR00282 family)